MSWKLIIERTENGYILTTPENGEEPEKKIVIQQDEEDELKAHELLLWEVLEYFGVYGSKHDPERLRIIREKNNE